MRALSHPLFARFLLAATLLASALFGGASASLGQEGNDAALPSWNDGSVKTAIIEFVERVTKEGGPDYVPPEERIATFDNDGTLWCEMPMYVQFAFAIDRVKTLAPEHAEWKKEEPFAAILEGHPEQAFEGGEQAISKLIAVTHAGMTTAEFETIVSDWIAKAEHPRFHRPYTDLTYLPMVELLAYLRANGFKTFIVSGGGIEFMRPWTEKSYGVPPEQVVGSSIVTEWKMTDAGPVLERLPKMNFVDDGPGKPVGINSHIGRRPIAAFGNSDGDLEMLQWTAADKGPSFCLIVHHTDAEREYAYDRKSPIGHLDKALDEATKRGWTVVDMKRDWKTIFAPPAAKPLQEDPRER